MPPRKGKLINEDIMAEEEGEKEFSPLRPRRKYLLDSGDGGVCVCSLLVSEDGMFEEEGNWISLSNDLLSSFSPLIQPIKSEKEFFSLNTHAFPREQKRKCK